jgi:DNA repair protein RadC
MPERLTSPDKVAKACVDYLGNYDREHFIVILLNTKARIIGVNTVSIGSLNASIVHPREVFKPAVILGAASVILVHNHPSGDPSPSQEDLEVTKRLADAGRILGITVLDHLIIGDNCYFSFKERGKEL